MVRRLNNKVFSRLPFSKTVNLLKMGKGKIEKELINFQICLNKTLFIILNAFVKFASLNTNMVEHCN